MWLRGKNCSTVWRSCSGSGQRGKRRLGSKLRMAPPPGRQQWPPDGRTAWDYPPGRRCRNAGQRPPEPLPPDLIRPVQKVCGGFAVKAEGAVSVLLQADKGQSGIGLVRKGDVAHVHAVTGQLLNDLVAKGVLPQLGQKCALTAQTGKCAADIGRRSPYPGAERGDLPKGTACPGGDQCRFNASPMEKRVVPGIFLCSLYK